MNRWYSQNGNNSDVVLASKIRLSRNLADVAFPCRMTDEQRKNCCKKIFAAIQNSELAGEFDLIELDKLSVLEKISLAEKGIISVQMAKQERYGAVLVLKDESVSIMLCEDDHITLTAFAPGQDLKKAYSVADRIDNVLINSLKIAFNEKFGFLTSNPMSLGTGMKASLVLHLPAISENGMVPLLKNTITKLGFDVIRLYGESGFYELSNNITLGITEKSAIDNLNAICAQITKQERAARQSLNGYDEYMDKLYRAMGTLKMARQLSAKEFYSLISLVRLGVSLHVFDDNDVNEYEVIGELMHRLGTATIISEAKNKLTADEANRLRAQYVRERLG